MDLRLAGKVGLVTGGGRGIGRRIALTLAQEGVRVVVNDLFAERAEDVAREITEAGGSAIGLAADVTDGQAVASMVQRAMSDFGTIDILVNNAGIPAPLQEIQTGGGAGGVFAETTPESWARTMGVITQGVLVVTHAVLPHMIRQSYGKIVSIISDAGVVGEPRLVAYSMAKAGVVGFSRALAKEVGRYRINVNCVAPGATKVEEGQPDRADRPVDPAEEAARYEPLFRLYPMARGYGRIGVPADVADPVVFLCSERSNWITGAVVRASGGYSIS